MDQNERFERIYNETRDDLLRFLIIRTNADPEAEDLFQEVYRRFYGRLCNSFLPILHPQRYLFAIARKVLSRFYRKRDLIRQNEEPYPYDAEWMADDAPLDERLLQSERKDAIWELLRDEPALSRRAFILYYGYERSHQEIADALGISKDAVRQRIHRTRQRIRSALESDCIDL